MILPGNAIVIDVTISTLPAAPLHALEIWSNAQAVAKRFQKAAGFGLPPMGQSAGNAAARLIRFEPTVWLVEGDVTGLEPVLGEVLHRPDVEGVGWRPCWMKMAR